MDEEQQEHLELTVGWMLGVSPSAQLSSAFQCLVSLRSASTKAANLKQAP